VGFDCHVSSRITIKGFGAPVIKLLLPKSSISYNIDIKL